MILVGIAVIILLYQIGKHSIEDAEMRDHARKNGWDTYPSRSGLKYTDTNKKYLGSKRWYEEEIIKKDIKDGLR